VTVVAERPTTSGRRTKPPRRPTAPRPWWGEGDAPHVRFPGVSITFEARWNGRRERWETHDGRYYFDAAAADRACEFFPTMLRHHIGEFADQPFELLEYQAKLLTRPIFGWKRALDGLRRFRKVFAFVPKGAGKSPWGSGTGLYLAIADNEPAAEVYAVAADKNQARVVHENAKIMVEKMIQEDDELAGEFDITKDSIVVNHTRSTYQVLSSDAATKHGFRPHGVIFDEFHAQRNRDLYEALKKSMPKRRQPLMVMITHAGDDDEGICFEEYEYAKGVLSGSIPDETCLPVIFEADPKDDWTSPLVWERVNPGHGITVKRDGIAAECLEAQNEPRKVNDFLRFHLNRWVNQATAWIPVDWWDACDDPMPPDDVLREMQGAIGIDMAQKIDLASAVAAFRVPLAERADDALDVETVTEQPDGQVVKRRLKLNYRLALVPAFWLPEETLEERSKKDGVRYDIWRDEGLLKVCDGAIINSQDIVDYVRDDHGGGLVERFPLLKQSQIGYDPAFATEIALDLRDDKHLTVVEVLQNYKHLSEACQVFEALVKAKRVIHGGHKLLRWNLENVAVKTDDAGRIRPVKPKKATKRIDGIVAAIIALNRLMTLPEPRRKRGKKARVWTPQGFVDAPV
jgi:phage terminase large subunit-like protein